MEDHVRRAEYLRKLEEEEARLANAKESESEEECAGDSEQAPFGVT